jgi:hypothetical protein
MSRWNLAGVDVPSFLPTLKVRVELRLRVGSIYRHGKKFWARKAIVMEYDLGWLTLTILALTSAENPLLIILMLLIVIPRYLTKPNVDNPQTTRNHGAACTSTLVATNPKCKYCSRDSVHNHLSPSTMSRSLSVPSSGRTTRLSDLNGSTLTSLNFLALT